MSLLDLPLLEHYKDSLGEVVINQMLNLYNQQSEKYLTEINSAIAHQSQDEWKEACHKMKGAAGSTGLIQLNRYLADKEKSIDEWSVKESYLVEVSKLNQESIEAFTGWLTNNAEN